MCKKFINRQTEMQTVWQLVKQGQRRKQICDTLHITTEEADALYNAARRRWGKKIKPFFAATMEQSGTFTRPKAEYSNKSYG